MGRPDATVSALRLVPGFEERTDAELAGIARLVDYCDVPAGTVLWREGSTGETGLVIIEGYAALSADGEVLEAVGPGELLGDPKTKGRRERKTTVIAKTPMRLLVIGPDAFHAIAAPPGY